MVIFQCHVSFQGCCNFYQVIQDEMDKLPETNSKIAFPKRKDSLPAQIFRGPTLVLGSVIRGT